MREMLERKTRAAHNCGLEHESLQPISDKPKPLADYRGIGESPATLERVTMEKLGLKKAKLCTRPADGRCCGECEEEWRARRCCAGTARIDEEPLGARQTSETARSNSWGKRAVRTEKSSSAGEMSQRGECHGAVLRFLRCWRWAEVGVNVAPRREKGDARRGTGHYGGAKSLWGLRNEPKSRNRQALDGG